MGSLKDDNNNRFVFQRGQAAHLDPADAMLSPELTAVFQPPDAGHGAAHGRAAELHRVPSWNSVELLLHTLDVCPVGTWGHSVCAQPGLQDSGLGGAGTLILHGPEYTPLER